MAFNLDFLKNIIPDDVNIFGASPNANIKELQALNLLGPNALEKARKQSLFQALPVVSDTVQTCVRKT